MAVDRAIAGSAMPSLFGHSPAIASAMAPTMLASALWRRRSLRRSELRQSQPIAAMAAT